MSESINKQLFHFSDIFMEKHWKSVVSRSVCDYFFECQSKCTNPEDIQAVIPTPHHQLFVVYRNKLFFVAVVTSEGSFLHHDFLWLNVFHLL